MGIYGAANALTAKFLTQDNYLVKAKTNISWGHINGAICRGKGVNFLVTGQVHPPLEWCKP
jgi:hypothetical protein